MIAPKHLLPTWRESLLWFSELIIGVMVFDFGENIWLQINEIALADVDRENLCLSIFLLFLFKL